MLNFLRQEIAKKEKEQKKAFHAQEAETFSELDEAILECAHLFNEMEELTIIGANAQRERPVIDIPIEDDIELDLVEVDTKTGRIVDIPMDVQTTEAFAQEKTYNDFYQETMRMLPRFHRESDQSYLNRVQEKAMQSYNEYYDYIVQEGLFGHDMISIDDPRVPGTAMIDFGKHSEDGSRHFMAKLPVYFQTQGDHQVSMAQIHSLTIAQNLNIFEDLGEVLKSMLIKDGHQKLVYNDSIWSIATPLYILIPIVKESYTVSVEIEVEGLKDHYFLTWSIPKSKVSISSNGKIRNKEKLLKRGKSGNVNDVQYPGTIKEATKDLKDKSSFICKKDFEKSKKDSEQKAFKESYGFPSRWDRRYRSDFYQEAIDFGGGMTPPDQQQTSADPGAPPPLNGESAGSPPPTDPTGGNPPTDSGMGGTDPTTNDSGNNIQTSPDASTATTNDVSQQIADSVANATAANTAAQSNANIMNTNPTFDNNVDDTFANLDSAMTGTDNPDMGDMDTSSTTPDAGTAESDPLLNDQNNADMSNDNPASSLDDIKTDMNDIDTSVPDSTDADSSLTDIQDENEAQVTNDDMKDKEMGNIDLDNMSMDDMVQQGIEKIKSMPMAQLREFLGDGAGAIGTSNSSDDLSLESFFEKDIEEEELTLEFENDLRSELNTGIRGILGGLNSADKPLKDIFRDVKHDAKHLNRVITRAIHTKNFSHAKRELEGLGHALNDLSLKLNDTPLKNEVQGIKDAIKHFTNAVRDTASVIDLSAKTVDDLKDTAKKATKKVKNMATAKKEALDKRQGGDE
jgi:hypothetical protein